MKKPSSVKKKNKNQQPTRIIVLVILIIALVLLSLFIGCLCLNRWHTNNNFNDMLSFISIIISFWTLLATIMIAVYIYNRQRRDKVAEEEKRKETAKKFMKSAVANGVSWLIREPSYRSIGLCYEIQEYMKQYGEILSELLTQNQFQTLMKLVGTVDKATHNESKNENIDRTFLFRDWVKPIMESYYSPYAAFAARDYDLLNKDVYDLLQCLEVENTEEPYKTTSVIKDFEGGILFEKSLAIHTDAYEFAKLIYNIYEDQDFFNEMNMQMYNHKLEEEIPFFDEEKEYVNVFNFHTIIFSGEIDVYGGIIEGFVRTTKYDGFVKNEQFSGPGIQYNEEHRKLREGFWKNDRLEAGIEYENIIYDANNSLKWNEKTQDYETVKEPDIIDMHCLYEEDKSSPSWEGVRAEIIENGLDDFYIVNTKILNQKALYYNIRSLRAYLEQNDPKVLDLLLCDISEYRVEF